MNLIEKLHGNQREEAQVRGWVEGLFWEERLGKERGRDIAAGAKATL